MHERWCSYAQRAAEAGATRAKRGRTAESDDDDDDDDAEGQESGDDADGEPVAAAAGPRTAAAAAHPRTDGRAANRGANKRRRYPFLVKADALDALANALERGETTQSVEQGLGLASGMLTKWRARATKIYSEAAKKLRRGLSRAALARAKALARYPAMEAELVKEVTRYRARGRYLSIRWLTVKARAIFARLYPEGGQFLATRSWRRRFMLRHRLTRLKVTNTKCKSVQERLPVANAFHEKLSLLVSSPPPGKPDSPMDDVYGRWLLSQRFNVDQVAVPWTSVADRTIDDVGADRPRMHVQAEGLLKRQATINLCFSAILKDRTKAGQIGLIFRGMGKLSAAEKAAYDPRVRVQFQATAWADRPTAEDWLNGTFGPIAATLEGEKLLFCDNLDAQVVMGFRAAARRLNTLVWYLPPNCTDFLRPWMRAPVRSS